jgi:hypothetical protein
MSAVCQGSILDNKRYRTNGLVPDEPNWSGFRDSSIGLGEKNRGTLRDVDSDPALTQPPL